MKIRRLEMMGFKSFVDPTVIEFNSPITAVVGPNGTGKSNVVDAIRWVMGEMSAKGLRGKVMEDIIFNGSDNRPPLGMASVSLTFSNEDGLVPVEYANFSEITITRRLFRSGESEYEINKVQCRLRDIVELFLGTGAGHRAYSLVEQGKIDFALNAKPEDRRYLIEEAAGVSKFKARKDAALRKMEGTKANMARLNDILVEVKRQVNSLDRQVKKAERYKKLKDELRGEELAVATQQFSEAKGKLTELEAGLKEWSEKEIVDSASLATAETDLDRMRMEAVEKEREFNTVQEKLYEVSNRLQLLEAGREYREKEKIELKNRSAKILEELEDSKSRQNTLEIRFAEKEEREKEIASESAGADERLAGIKQEWQKLNDERETITRNIEDLKNGVQSHNERIVGNESRKKGLEERRVEVKGRIARVDAELGEVAKGLDGLDAKCGVMGGEIKSYIQREEKFSEQIKDIRSVILNEREAGKMKEEELNYMREALLHRRSRLRSLMDLERNLEGYQDGVKSLLGGKRALQRKKGVFGVVADFIETTPEYETAAGAVLGEKLQYVVVESQAQGVEAVLYLKQESVGRSTFIPLSIREDSSDMGRCEGEGVIGPMLNYVNFKEPYKKVGQYLLGDVVLVEDLTKAVSLWQSNGHKKTLVTVDGDVVDPHGVISGGSDKSREKVILENKREIKRLHAEVSDLEKELDIKEEEAAHIEGRINAIEVSLVGIEKESREVAIKKAALENDFHHKNDDLTRLRNRREFLETELRELTDNLTDIDNQTKECERGRDLSGVEKEKKEGEIGALEMKLEKSAPEMQGLNDKLSEFRVQASFVSERMAQAKAERVAIENDLKVLKEYIEKKKQDVTEANARIGDIKAEDEEAVVEIEKFKVEEGGLRRSHDSLKKNYSEMSGMIQEREAALRGIRAETNSAREKAGEIKIELARLQSDTDHLISQMFEKYAVDLNVIPAEEMSPEIMAEKRAKIGEIRDKLENMGEVNLGAIPEYNELKERHDFLSKQMDDLTSSLDSLEKAITRINYTTRKRFKETFDSVNEKFQDLLPKLFKGGKARLTLTDENDLLGSGVDVMVQPPGKRLSHITLLSGGEKALSAVALIFSIFLVKPSPFCILDEVDAPLDDVNVERFHSLIKELTGRSQFILITHNKQTMEMADTLYGVTMEEPGASKIVSVQLN